MSRAPPACHLSQDCVSDNDAFATTGAVTSFSTVDGCCLKECSKAVKAVRLVASHQGSSGRASAGHKQAKPFAEPPPPPPGLFPPLLSTRL
jgi:hypothetical protein